MFLEPFQLVSSHVQYCLWDPWFPVANTGSILMWHWSTIMFRLPAAFKICSTTATVSVDAHESIPQSIRQPVHDLLYIGEQLFARNMAYTGTNIDIMNAELLFIRPEFSHSSIHGFSGPFVGIFDDDAWSEPAHELNVCCLIRYPRVSVELSAPKQLYLDLY